jgi:hypothetical protein
VPAYSSDDLPNRLDKRSQLQRSDGRGRQHGREEERVGWRDDDDVVLVRIQLLKQWHTAPARTQYYQLGSVFELLILFALVIVDEVVGDWQVLGPASPWAQSEFGHGEVGCDGVFIVCVGVVDEEGDDETTADGDEGAEYRVLLGAALWRRLVSWLNVTLVGQLSPRAGRVLMRLRGFHC